ncbi:hypothetical protein [Glycomyces sp. NPDC048151]|uniref:hypothetical protein n=1 Tax=Glycomyces sp. NPDC048151 TaxID=3364002 RepID=UPI0037176338
MGWAIGAGCACALVLPSAMFGLGLLVGRADRHGRTAEAEDRADLATLAAEGLARRLRELDPGALDRPDDTTDRGRGDTPDPKGPNT